MKTLLSALLLVLVTPACFISRQDTNRSLDLEQVRTLVPGQTTAAEVVARLGAPNDVVQLGRRSAYLYAHTREKQAALFLLVIGLRGVDTQSDRTWVFFDENDVLSHVGSTFAADDAEYAIPPWID